MINFSAINNLLKAEPAFRYRQIYEAIFSKLVSDWEEISSLPKDLRAELALETDLKLDALKQQNSEGSTKATLVLVDGKVIECVLLRHEDGRRTVCVSCQVGCPLACVFCATGRLGFSRNLSAEEIVSQVLYFARLLKTKQERVTNVVFMGMGEPLLNLDNVLKAIDILNNPKYFGIAARSISISTVGIPEGIKKIGNYKKQINLAWSLHAPNDKLRQQLMPIGKKYKIDKVMSVLDHYYEKTKRQIMVEYLLIKGVNDSEKHALELASLLSGHNFFLNLIRYNATGHFLPSDSLAIENFKKILKKEKINFGQRHSFGGQISAACGQLAGKK